MSEADQVFGRPLQKGQHLIIPAAEVVSALGYGAVATQPGTQETEPGERSFSRPVAVIVTSPEGISVEPVVDFSKIALAALTVGLFLIGFFSNMLNPRKTLKKLSKGEWD